MDGSYQSLEITGNYFFANAIGNPLLRRNTLCITCHAPTAASFLRNLDGKEGTLNSNLSIAQALREDDVNRELNKPAAAYSIEEISEEFSKGRSLADLLDGTPVNDLLPPRGGPLKSRQGCLWRTPTVTHAG
jgi:hypothetical protein